MNGLIEKVSIVRALLRSGVEFAPVDAVSRPRLSVRSGILDTVACSFVDGSNASYMGLNDLMLEIKNDSATFIGDEATENKVLRQVLQLVEDKISEVKNQAVKWCAELLFVGITAHDVGVALVNSSRSSASLRWNMLLIV